MSRDASRSTPRVRSWVIHPLQDFLREESSGGIVLLVATIAALVWSNSPWGSSYEDMWSAELSLGIGRLAITESLQHWVNDGLMTIFFFVVGLEIKRELVTGELRDPRKAALPVVAAVGGMVVPAGLYLLLNFGGSGSRGWGIPMATDIAFAVGVLTVLGRRVPSGLKLFLLTLAIVDDIGAILVIAAFYTRSLSLGWLAVAVASVGVIALMRTVGLPWPLAYVPIGFLAWLATFESGIHPTIAGVAIALITPAHPVRGRPLLGELEHRLHPISSYLIVPVFALANAGVALRPEVVGDALRSPVFWGIPLGLVVGKMLGISAAALAAVRLKLARLPLGVHGRHIVGAGALGGIGFTVSLFITALAFRRHEATEIAKMGVLLGSTVSAVVGTTVLMRTRRHAVEPAIAPEGPERG